FTLIRLKKRIKQRSSFLKEKASSSRQGLISRNSPLYKKLLIIKHFQPRDNNYSIEWKRFIFQLSRKYMVLPWEEVWSSLWPVICELLLKKPYWDCRN